MPITESDIKFTLSGGINNDDPNKSLGGDPSPIVISNNINNLFDDIQGLEAEEGRIEYRCFYIFNDNETHDFRNIRIWIKSQVDLGASVEIGIGQRNHVQVISIFGSPTSGTFKLSYDGVTPSASINWNEDVSILAASINDYVDSQFGLETTTIGELTADAERIFTVTFVGDSGGRYHPDFVVSQNLLVPSATIMVQSTINGQPINAVAADVGDEETAPEDVSFSDPSSEAEALLVGTLKPLEHFFVWVKRTINANTSSIIEDGFTLSVRGGTLP